MDDDGAIQRVACLAAAGVKVLDPVRHKPAFHSSSPLSMAKYSATIKLACQCTDHP